MKQAELQAKVATGVLIVIAVVLLIASYLYGATIFWAGGLAALGQALLTGLAAWGLVLGRQQQDLNSELDVGTGLLKSGSTTGVGGGLASLSGFKMSAGDDEPIAAKPKAKKATVTNINGTLEVRTLETGFQRVVVALTGTGFLVLSAIICYLIYQDISLTKVGEPIIIARPGEMLNNLAVALAVLSLLAYWGAYYFSRNRGDDEIGGGDAVRGILTMGLPGMVGLALGVVLGWLQVQYAVQLTAALVALLLVVQGAELLVSSMRSYAGIEEFDQEPVDLQKLPLVPMLTSLWVLGLKGLLVQSVGLSGGEKNRLDGSSTEPGLFAQMMPRVLVSILVLAVLASMVRVVKPGEVAIRERLGQATDADIDHPLEAGLHFCWPWPLDELVRIPVQNAQELHVGTEEPIEVINGKKMDFNFWTMKHTLEGASELEYVTGDKPSPQLLGTFVSIWWRVKNPSLFYRRLSHSEFFEAAGSAVSADGKQVKMVARPIYESMIQQMASRTVTHTFASHTLDQIMGSGRVEVEHHCLQTLQENLDKLGSGIEIMQLTIKDVHPPMGMGPLRRTVSGEPDGGPAAMYEYVVISRELRETMINLAQGDQIETVKKAEGESARIIADADIYASDRTTAAKVERARRLALAQQYKANPELSRQWLQTRALEETLPGIRKVLVAPGVPAPDLWQPNRSGNLPMGAGTTGGSSPGNP